MILSGIASPSVDFTLEVIRAFNNFMPEYVENLEDLFAVDGLTIYINPDMPSQLPSISNDPSSTPSISPSAAETFTPMTVVAGTAAAAAAGSVSNSFHAYFINIEMMDILI